MDNRVIYLCIPCRIISKYYHLFPAPETKISCECEKFCACTTLLNFRSGSSFCDIYHCVLFAGGTPQRRQFSYPTKLVRTEPHEVLKERFQASYVAPCSPEQLKVRYNYVIYEYGVTEETMALNSM